MIIPIPDFIWFPSHELRTTLSIIALVVGICLTCAGLVLYYLLNKKRQKVTRAWICMIVGILLILNHGIQLLFWTL